MLNKRCRAKAKEEIRNYFTIDLQELAELRNIEAEELASEDWDFGGVADWESGHRVNNVSFGLYRIPFWSGKMRDLLRK